MGRTSSPTCSRGTRPRTTSRRPWPVTHDAVEHMGRHVESFDLRDLLARNVEHPRLAATAERCLTCGNCTLVCPTCFCTSVDDVNVLESGAAERWRRWDSCYSQRLLVHPRRQRAAFVAGAIPPVADAQVRHLDRPVRHLGLRRVRALHHLVPGRDRRDRGARGDPCHGRGGGPCKRLTRSSARALSSTA